MHLLKIAQLDNPWTNSVANSSSNKRKKGARITNLNEKNKYELNNKILFLAMTLLSFPKLKMALPQKTRAL